MNKNNWPVWATESVEIVRPNLKWKVEGELEQKSIYALLSQLGVKSVEHIGSTSISNLSAKPIIDLMAEIESFEKIAMISEKLSGNDWHYVDPDLDNRPWRRFFVKVKDNKRVAHLHLVVEGNKRWEEQLLFRDRLRKNPHLVAEYELLKQKLSLEFKHDREIYTKEKTSFINHVRKCNS